MSSGEYQFMGLWVPREMFEIEILTWEQTIYILDIQARGNRGDERSNEELARFLKIKPRTVRLLLSDMSEKKFVSINIYGRRRRIFLGKAVLGLLSDFEAKIATRAKIAAIPLHAVGGKNCHVGQNPDA